MRATTHRIAPDPTVYHALFANAAVCLVMGLALVALWRHDPRQGFGLHLGLAFLVQTLVPSAYALAQNIPPPWSLLPTYALPLASALYTTLLLGGAAQLAANPFNRRGLALVALTFLATNLLALVLGGLTLMQTSVGGVNTGIGLLCAYWLRRSGAHWRDPQRWVGPLLVGLGLIQFIYALWGDAGAALMASLGTVLRLALGLALLYAAGVRMHGRSQALQDQFWRLTQRSLQGIAVLAQGRLRYANPAFLHIYGVYSIDELSPQRLAATIPVAERAGVARMQQRVLERVENEISYEAERTRPDGRTVWLRVQYFLTEWEGRDALQVLVSDETRRHTAAQALEQQALTDGLTALPNRPALLQLLHERCPEGAVAEPFVLLVLDLDRFSLFNQAHGHSVADEVLVAFAQTLRQAMPTDHQLMRLGEDEFAVVSPSGCGGETAVQMAALVRRMLARPLQVSTGSYFVNVSMGLALYPHSARCAESLLRAANAALHEAKHTPGTSHELAKKEFERDSSNLLEQEQALRAGLQENEFELVFQPKVDAHSHKLVGFEALARWNRPGTGASVGPQEFIAAAERTGMMPVLGAMLLRQACEKIAAWQAHYRHCVPVAVNVSPQQLLDSEFPAMVARLLRETGVPPRYLSLEITESCAVQNLEQTVLQIAQLRSMGIDVALDDFGAGHSSLNLLRQLHTHSVKIDQGLIAPLPEAESQAVVHAICELARALNMAVVAEGIETEAQAHSAAQAGCDQLQGFFFAKPLDAIEAGNWIALAGTTQRHLELDLT